MGQNNGFEFLARNTPLTDEEWVGLIETRRELIKPHLDSFTLPELGALKCLRQEGSFLNEIQLTVSESTGDTEFSLKTQGIFHAQEWADMERVPNSGYPPANCLNGTMRIWGLTRNGEWVLVTVDFIGEPGWKNRGCERATSVNIVKSDVPAILAQTKVKPHHMWEKIGHAIIGFAERRRNLYEQALKLAKQVAVEDNLYDWITDKNQ